MKTSLICSFILISLIACKKQEVLEPEKERVVNLTIKGYVMSDTLEFVLQDKVLGFIVDSRVLMTASYFNANDKLLIRKRANKQAVGEIVVTEQPYNQVKKIYYDGVKLSDNLELTQVANPENMGFRLRFSTPFKDFYGGPVDMELIDQYINWDTFEFFFTPVKTISNITGSFGEFIELPPLAPEHTYVFKIYKAGTKELPYTSMDHVYISDPEYNFGSLPNFKSGDSGLYSIGPYGNEDKSEIADGYELIDFSAAFK